MLRQAGLVDWDMTVSPEAAATGYADEAAPHAKGFWASFEEMFGGTDHHHAHEGVRRGDIVVAAHVVDARLGEAADIRA